MADIAIIVEKVSAELSAGRTVALCAIIATRGSTPQPAGTMLCVDQAAGITGTLGGGCVEAEVRRRAHQLLQAGRSELISFRLDQDFGHDDGMICGGEMDVAVTVLPPSTDPGPYRNAAEQLRAGDPAVCPMRIETQSGSVEYRIHIEAAPQLLIAGAGHISRCLARTVAPLGFAVHVVDERADYANPDRFPAPVRTVVGDIAGALASWPIGSNTYIVIVTRGHKHDEVALQAVLNSPARYIGMIGSRRKIVVIFEDLRHLGATAEQLERVHAPIGLDIGAVTTDEIALSIAAQLVSERRSRRHKAVEGPIPISDEIA